MRKILNNKLLISIIMSSIFYYVMCDSKIIQVYNPFSWIIYLALILLFNHVDWQNKNFKKERIIFSVIFSFLLVFGELVYSLMDNAEISVFRSFFTLKIFFKLIGTFNIFFVILSILFPNLYDFNIFGKKSIIKKPWVLFVICFIVMLLGWLPYFLSYYPGTLSPDSYGILMYGSEGVRISKDNLPILYVLFVLTPFKLGQTIFNSNMIGVVFSTVTQMICMSALLSRLILFLYNRKVKDSILIIVLLFFTLLPMHGFYSIVMWKDVMFSILLLQLIIEAVKVVEKSKNDNLKFKNLISFTIISTLCLFFRHNALYLYIIFAMVTFVLFRKYYKTFMIVFTIVFGIYFFVRGPVFNYFDIEKTGATEYVGIPLQQIGRMAFKHVEFSNEEIKTIEKFIPFEDLAINYNPKVVDGIKFSKNYIWNGVDENKLEFFKLWIKLVFKHPSIAVESYAVSTLGYWYPGVNYWSVEKGLIENPYGIKKDSKLSPEISEFYNNLESRDTPILNIEWSIGLCFWIILLFGFISFKKHSFKGLYPYVVIFGLWLTMMVASPVFSEFRYVYAAFISLPLFILCPYLELSDKKIVKDN